MKTKVYFGIAIRIIALFSIGMIGTFIPEHLHEFFGDVKGRHSPFGFDPQYIWGARHYWYFWMMMALFILSAVNVIISIVKILKKEYDI